MTEARRAPGLGDDLGDVLEDVVDGQEDADVDLGDAPIGETTRPALAALERDQSRMVKSFIAGFESRADFIRWSQQAIIATLGELDDDWFRERAMSRAELSHLIVSDSRHKWVDDNPPDAGAAEQFRRTHAAQALIPACRDAFRRLRWSAVEYVDDEEDLNERPDPADQQHSAMRPALSELEDAQDWAVRQCIQGFGDVDELTDWLMVAIHASYGEVDGDLSAMVWRERNVRDMLVVEPMDHDHGPFFRESFVARRLLPPFNRAARELSDRAGELPTEPDAPDQSPLKYE